MNRPSTATLEALLVLAQGHYRKVVEMLKAIPPQWPEYEALIVREDKLAFAIRQIEGQLAALRGVK